MKYIVGIDCKGNKKIEYFYTNGIHLKKNITVIVNTEKGIEFGKILTKEHPVEENKLNKKLGEILRIATKKDYSRHKKNLKDAEYAFEKCKLLIKKYDLKMNLLEARYTFDRDQLVFHFFSDERVDFRQLARDLANTYKVRIELRQVGVRDRSKMIGGIGPCGQKLCCARYLKEFDSVSISMAKNQNLALSPNKINGVCGRLLCCLKYEDDCYKKCKASLPKMGSYVNVGNKQGKVVSINLLQNKYTVEIDGVGQVEVEV